MQQPAMASGANQMNRGIFTSTVSVNPRQLSVDPLYPEEIFTGGFSADSPAYAKSCDHSGIPANRPGTHQWFYQAKIITYATHCPTSISYDLFLLNQPVAIVTGTTDRAHNPFTLYGMVRSIHQWSDTVPAEVNYSIMVEVHVKPGFTIDWSKTRPWPCIPVGALFIFPHTFQNVTHQPIEISPASVRDAEDVWYDAADLDQNITYDREMYQIMLHRSRVHQTSTPSTVISLPPSSSSSTPRFVLYSQRTGKLVSGNSSDEEDEEMVQPSTSTGY